MIKNLYRSCRASYHNSGFYKKTHNTKRYQKKVEKWLVDNWNENNKHNYTKYIAGDQDKISIGRYTYGDIKCLNFNNPGEMLEIGDFCSIAGNVTFLAGGGHYMDNFSTYPFEAYFTDKTENALTKGKIKVEDDVWIGYGSTILSGVTIGQGAVIGADSVVVKDVPPYAVFAGGRIVKYRYTEDIIEKMMKFDFSKLTESDIKENADLLYHKVDDSFFTTDFYKNHLK